MADRRALTPDADVRAAELALGLLEGDARQAAEAERRTVPAFADGVRVWEEMAQNWSAGIDPIDPPAGLWDRISASLGGETEEADHETVGVPPAANDGGAAAPESGRHTVWKYGTIAASLAALAFAGMWIARDRDIAERDDRIAALSNDLAQANDDYRVAQVNGADTPALLTALYDGSSGEMTVRVQTANNEGLVPELWVIGPDGQPRSLGQSGDSATIVIPLSPAMQEDIAAGSSIAISLEPKSDRPSDTPTAENILGAAQLVPLT